MIPSTVDRVPQQTAEHINERIRQQTTYDLDSHVEEYKHQREGEASRVGAVTTVVVLVVVGLAHAEASLSPGERRSSHPCTCR